MTDNRDNFVQAMNRGHTAAWEQKWGQAAEFYRQALEEIPDDPTALNSLGLALYEMREYREAGSCYERASRLQPDDPIPHEKLGMIHEIQNDIPGAVRAFSNAAEIYFKNQIKEKSIDNWNKVVSLQPSNMQGHTRLAMLHEKSGRKTEAAAEYHQLAALLQARGVNQKAIQAAEYALKLAPGNEEISKTLDLLRKNQMPAVAASPVKKMQPLRPTPVETTRALTPPGPAAAACYDPIEEGRRAALSSLAEIMFEESETGSPAEGDRAGTSADNRGTGSLICKPADRPKIFLQIGQAIAAESNGNHTQAGEELDRAISLGLVHPAAFYLCGLLDAGKSPEKALQQLTTASKRVRFSLPAYLLMGNIAHDNGQFGQAVLYKIQALRLADLECLPPADAERIDGQYESILQDQSILKKEESFLRKLSEDISSQLVRPNWRQYFKTAREQLSTTSEDRHPVPMINLLMGTGGGKVVETTKRIQDLASVGAFRTAMEEAFSGILESPDYLPLQTQIADLLAQQGRLEDAVNKYKLVARLYTLRGEAGQAVRLLTKAGQMVPMDIHIHRQLIDLLISQGRTEEAIAQYLETAQIYYQLADLDNTLEMYQNALRLSSKTPALRPTTVRILYKIADINLQQVNWKSAIKVFEQIRTLEPEDIIARVHLVSLNYRLNQDLAGSREVEVFTQEMEQAGKPEKAIEFLKMILLDHPENLDIKKRLADFYIRDGETGQAVKILASITDSLFKTGQLRTAAKILETIITLNPPNAGDYQKILSRVHTRLDHHARPGSDS